MFKFLDIKCKDILNLKTFIRKYKKYTDIFIDKGSKISIFLKVKTCKKKIQVILELIKFKINLQNIIF